MSYPPSAPDDRPADGAEPSVPIVDALRAHARALGFESLGIAAPDPSEHIDTYRSWIESGRHADMDYLARPDAIERRGRPGTRNGTSDPFPVRSLVVVTHPYAGADPEGVPDDPSVGVVARYARGRDYHNVLRKRLGRLLARLDETVRASGDDPGPSAAGVRGHAFVDAGPVLERELARRAGLGWFGRNTMLIDPTSGSYLLLGVLAVDLALPPSSPFTADRCGSCSACIPACPTGALEGRDETGAPVLDARKCISYWTIETDAPIPADIRTAMGNRVFGCDICQEVCPWNRFADPDGDPAYAARGPGAPPPGVEPLPDETAIRHPGTERAALVDLFAMSETEWRAWSRGSPLRRAGYDGFRRSVAVAIGNWLAGLDEPPPDAVGLLRAALDDRSEVVRDHAAWALARATSPGHQPSD